MNPAKLCECGCGNPAPIAKRTNKKFGHVKGQPVRFIQGHNLRSKTNPGRTLRKDGYWLVYDDKGRRVLEHRLVAERMLNRPLERNEIVHHINGDRGDNRPENLKVLDGHAAHVQEHLLQRLEGVSLWRKVCSGCDRQKDFKEFGKKASNWDGLQNQCKDCTNARIRERRRRKHANRTRQAQSWAIAGSDI